MTSLQMVKTPFNKRPGYDIKQSDGNLRTVEYPFIAIALRSTLTQSGGTWKGPIYGSTRTVWHLNCMQTNNLH